METVRLVIKFLFLFITLMSNLCVTRVLHVLPQKYMLASFAGDYSNLFFWEQMHHIETKEEKETRFRKEKYNRQWGEMKQFHFHNYIMQNIFIEPGEFRLELELMWWQESWFPAPTCCWVIPWRSWASVPNIKQSDGTGWLLKSVLFLGTSDNSHLRRHANTAPTEVHKAWLLLGPLVLPVWSVTCWKFSSTETL